MLEINQHGSRSGARAVYDLQYRRNVHNEPVERPHPGHDEASEGLRPFRGIGEIETDGKRCIG